MHLEVVVCCLLGCDGTVSRNCELMGGLAVLYIQDLDVGDNLRRPSWPSAPLPAA